MLSIVSLGQTDLLNASGTAKLLRSDGAPLSPSEHDPTLFPEGFYVIG